MDQESLSYRTLKNLSYNFFGFAWPILFSVFITPVIVRGLGVTEYGIYILINSIMAILGLFDFGIAVSLLKFVSELHAQNNISEMKRVLHSANLLFFIIGVFGFFCFGLLGTFFQGWFHISSVGESHLQIVFFLAGIVFLMNSIITMVVIIPQALQRFDISTKFSLTQLTIFNLLSLILVTRHFQLKAILLANIFTQAGLIFALYRKNLNLLPQISIGFIWDSSSIKKLYSFGFYAFINNISQGALNQLDRLIIPAFLNPAQLSYYSLPGNVAQKTSTIIGSMGGVFLPLASSMSGTDQLSSLGSIYRRVIRVFAVFAAAMTTAIIIFGEKILHFWLGQEFAKEGVKVLWILALTYFITALFGTTYNFLMGIGKVKLLAICSVLMALLNLILLVLWLPKFGIVGAAWAYLLGVTPMVFVFYWTEKKYLKLNNMVTSYGRLLGKILAVSFIFSLISYYGINRYITSFLTLVLIGPLTVVLYLVLYYIFGFFESDDVKLLKSFIIHIGHRFGLKSNP